MVDFLRRHSVIIFLCVFFVVNVLLSYYFYILSYNRVSRVVDNQIATVSNKIVSNIRLADSALDYLAVFISSELKGNEDIEDDGERAFEQEQIAFEGAKSIMDALVSQFDDETAQASSSNSSNTHTSVGDSKLVPFVGLVRTYSNDGGLLKPQYGKIIDLPYHVSDFRQDYYSDEKMHVLVSDIVSNQVGVSNVRLDSSKYITNMLKNVNPIDEISLYYDKDKLISSRLGLYGDFLILINKLPSDDYVLALIDINTLVSQALGGLDFLVELTVNDMESLTYAVNSIKDYSSISYMLGLSRQLYGNFVSTPYFLKIDATTLLINYKPSQEYILSLSSMEYLAVFFYGFVIIGGILLFLYFYRVETRNVEMLVKMKTKDLQVANARLEEMSYRDGLTKLYNKLYFELRFNDEWFKAIEEQRSIGLIMLDIDYFKFYNDYYGHARGDECLVKVANSVRTVAEDAGGVVARYGGEEIVILLANATVEDAYILGEKIRLSVESERIPHIRSLVMKTVTVSLGVSAMIPVAGDEHSTLIVQADKALYVSKDKGRNAITAYSER